MHTDSSSEPLPESVPSTDISAMSGSGDVAMAEPDTVTDVLRKRVYAFDVEMDAEEDVSEQQVQALAHYLHETHLALANTDATALMQGEIRFRGPGGEAGGGEIAQQASS